MKAQPALAQSVADPRADQAEELRQLLALSPDDLEFLDRVEPVIVGELRPLGAVS